MSDFLTGVEAVAKHFGVTVRTVYRWQREGMPRLSQNRYDPLQIREWRERQRGILRPAGPGYVDPKQMTFGDVGSGSGAGKDYQEERLKKAKADLAEMEVLQRRAELIPRGEVSKEIVQRHTGLRQGLLALQRALPPVLIHCQSEREMEVLLGEAFRELLAAWSRPLPDRLGGVDVETVVQEMADGGGNLES